MGGRDARAPARPSSRVHSDPGSRGSASLARSANDGKIHACRSSGFKPCLAVLQDKAISRSDLHPMSGFKENIWKRFSPFHLLACYNDREEIFKPNRFEC